MIPFMKAAGNLSTHQITSTSLFAISISCCFGSLAYIESKTANIPAAMAIASVSTLTGIIGARAAHFISGNTLSRLLAVVMLCFIPLILTKEYRQTEVKGANNTGGLKIFINELKSFHSYNWNIKFEVCKDFLQTHSIFPLVGAVTGFASGMFGIGGGTL